MGTGRSGKGSSGARRDGQSLNAIQRDSASLRRYIPQKDSYYDYRQRYIQGELKEVPVAAIEEQVRGESEAYKRLQAEGSPLPPSTLEFNYPSGSREAKWQEVELRLRRKYGLPVRTIAQQR